MSDKTKDKIKDKKVTLAMIVRDNEKDMERILPKVKDFFSEIVIIDTGSKDKTKEVCKRYGAKIYDFKWVDDFSKARNFSFSKVKTDWVFWLDSDDKVSGLENLEEMVKSAEANSIDGYVLLYNYARDEYGNVLSVQWRERLLRKKKFEWKGQIHETAIQKSHALVVKHEGIIVDHLATPEDMAKSNKRNLEILEAEVKKDGDKVDPRTLYYMAQTYRGIKDWKNAGKYYVDYLKVGAWDEERMQAWHFLADAMRMQGQYEQAIIADHEALKIKPDWPDAYFGLGDTYFYMADVSEEKEYWENAIEWIKNGFTKKVPDTVRVLEPNRYTWMPLLQLAICQLNLSSIDEAFKNYTKAYELSNGADFVGKYLKLFKDMKEKNDATESFLEYIEYLSKYDKSKMKNIDSLISKDIGDDPRVSQLRNSVVPPKTWDDKSVAIFCAGAYEEWAAPSVIKGIGGSEEAVIYLSRELVKQGYKVTVYNTCGSLRGTYEGVDYRYVWELNPNDKFNVFISWRNPFSFNRIQAKHKWVWLHDVPEQAKDTFTDEVVKDIDKVIVLSKYHKSLIPMVPNEKIFVTNNGIVPEQFKDLPKKEKNSLFWGSSYDRGLDCFLRDIYPIVLKEIPDLTLDICYGWKTFDEMNKNNPTNMKWKDTVVALMNQKGITHHGRVSHKKVAELMGASSVWAYPTEFPEINCHPAGTRIMTDTGEVEIEKLSFDNNVITHTGKIKPILTLMRRKADKLLRFTVQAGDDLLCTPEHPLYVLRDGKPQFVEAKDIIKPTQWKNRGFKPGGDFLITPKVRVDNSNLVLDTTYNGKQNNFDTTTNNVSDKIMITPKLAWLIGYFAGDGTAGLRTGEVSVLVADKHPEHINKVLDGFKELGLLPRVVKCKGCMSYRVSSYKLARAFRKYFYENGVKMIPFEFLNFSETLDGLLAADGHVNGYNCSFTNKSLHLIGFVRMALASQGLSARTIKRIHKNGCESYSMSWTETDGNGFYRNDDKWILHKIKKIEEIKHNGWVYNLEVVDDNSFVANGHAVHNCITAQKAQCANTIPVTTDVAALKETNKYGVKIKTDTIYSNKEKQEEFAKEVIKQLKNPIEMPVDKAIKEMSWETTAKAWIKEWSV